jgi:hypothetical protein
MSSSVLAILFGACYMVFRLLISHRTEGWQGVKNNLLSGTLHGVVFGVAWWIALFAYQFFIKVPREIRTELVPPPSLEWKKFPEMFPRPPRFAYEKSIIAKPPIDEIVHPYDLADERREKFKALLKPAPDETDTLRIGCLAGSDSACVVAGQFLILFSEAGWKIDSNRVFQMQPQIPVSGVVVATLPQQPAPPNLPPHLGVWQAADKSETKIVKAFTQMSVPVHPVGGPDLPTGTLGVYFGPDPGPQTTRLYMLLSDCKPASESCDMRETTTTYGAFLTTGSDRQVVHADHPRSVHFNLEASDKEFTVRQSELPRTLRLGRCLDHFCTITILRFTLNRIIIDSRSATFWDKGNEKMASVLIHWKLLKEGQ